MKPFYNRTIPHLLKLGSRWHGWLAALLLLIMFGLGITSMLGDSAIDDEIAHVPAAYSYVHYGDYRLNPEHPPLIKDLAGLPLQFMQLKFPTDNPTWTTEPNGEWNAGWAFLYDLGNDANAILFWARLPILLLAVTFGALIYRYVWRRWGKATALLTLFFYTLSPNIIAHARFVTTDLGASVFIFLALVTFVRFAERPQRQNVILLSLALAAAQLAKFSAVLLFPYLAVMAFVLVGTAKTPSTLAKRLKTYLGGLFVASGLSILWVWLVYIPQTINMPIDVQDRLIPHALPLSNVEPIANFLLWLDKLPLCNALAQYLLGVTMVFGRVAGGNVTFFNGQIHNGGFIGYFPEIFLVKTQVAFLILGGIAIGLGLWHFFHRRPTKLSSRLADSFRQHLAEWVLGGFAGFYFLVSMAGNLNLGIRHILPIYIPLFILVAISTVRLVRRLVRTRWGVLSRVGLAVLLGWYALSTILIYPHFLAYFNELIGGPNNAEYYFSDSGVDWGQDLLRLKTYVHDNHIDHIAIDYFGGADPRYYFCNRTYYQQQLITTRDAYDCTGSVYENWHSSSLKYQGQYIAVSETYLENDRFYAGLAGNDGYQYLRNMKPIARIGYSIYVFKMY